MRRDEMLYKIKVVIEYLKTHNGYKYKLYNSICPEMGFPDSNIVEYAEDVKAMIEEEFE